MYSLAIDSVYLFSAVLFIVGIKMLSSPKSAMTGNYLSGVAMALTVGATLIAGEVHDYTWIAVGVLIGTVIGAWSARAVRMTAMPQMVALFNGLGGAASALVGVTEYFRQPESPDPILIGVILLSLFVGTITFSGSVAAFGKLQELLPGRPVVYLGQNVSNALMALGSLAVGIYLIASGQEPLWFYVLGAVSLVLGVTVVLPIGGADMPVIIALLNSFSGIAVAFAGFVLSSNVLIIVGSLVGASGIFLTNAMCQAMNRSIWNVIFGAFGQVGAGAPAAGGPAAGAPQGSVKAYTIEDGVTILENAALVIVVPGFGMAAAQAQHAVRELAQSLAARNVEVKFAIHPVAGRMPGHMNVLLAEANVPYEQLFDMDQINEDFKRADVALIIGANDVVNPAANEDPASPIYGMPILKAEEARSVIVLKRSMNPGFAGIENRLFLRDNTMMIFGDAKSTLQKLVDALHDGAR